MHLGNWQLDTIRGGDFWIDGGVMFGVVPKSLWSPLVPPDDQNRVHCANHCVLARDGQHTVLIDTGYGGPWAPLDRRFYSMEEGHPLLTSLSEQGIDPADIDTVVFSHLHFDHVGGASPNGPNQHVALACPTARHVVGRLEWQDATSQSNELRTAYHPRQLAPLQACPRIELVDDDDEIVPGLRARITGGHTRGHMALLFESQGQTAVYLGDICPSTAHLRTMWHTAYDLYPLDTRRRKPAWLGEASDQGWWILWNHDPGTAVSRVVRDPKREFIAVDGRPRL